MFYEKIAKQILEIDEWSPLPEDLDKTLYDIDKLCEKAGGLLASRQMIATIIYDYLKKKDNGK